MAQYTGDFFQGRLDTLIDPNHELAILSTKLPWAQLEAALAPLLQKKQRPILVATDALSGLLFEPHAPASLGAAISPAGRPRHAIRLMCSLIFLKHKYNLSDEAMKRCARIGQKTSIGNTSAAQKFMRRSRLAMPRRSVALELRLVKRGRRSCSRPPSIPPLQCVPSNQLNLSA